MSKKKSEFLAEFQNQQSITLKSDTQTGTFAITTRGTLLPFNTTFLEAYKLPKLGLDKAFVIGLQHGKLWVWSERGLQSFAPDDWKDYQKIDDDELPAQLQTALQLSQQLIDVDNTTLITAEENIDGLIVILNMGLLCHPKLPAIANIFNTLIQHKASRDKLVNYILTLEYASGSQKNYTSLTSFLLRYSSMRFATLLSQLKLTDEENTKIFLHLASFNLPKFPVDYMVNEFLKPTFLKFTESSEHIAEMRKALKPDIFSELFHKYIAADDLYLHTKHLQPTELATLLLKQDPLIFNNSNQAILSIILTDEAASDIVRKKYGSVLKVFPAANIAFFDKFIFSAGSNFLSLAEQAELLKPYLNNKDKLDLIKQNQPDYLINFLKNDTDAAIQVFNNYAASGNCTFLTPQEIEAILAKQLDKDAAISDAESNLEEIKAQQNDKQEAGDIEKQIAAAEQQIKALQEDKTKLEKNLSWSFIRNRLHDKPDGGKDPKIHQVETLAQFINFQGLVNNLQHELPLLWDLFKGEDSRKNLKQKKVLKPLFAYLVKDTQQATALLCDTVAFQKLSFMPDITIPDLITVQDLAKQIFVSPAEVNRVLKKLEISPINTIDQKTASAVIDHLRSYEYPIDFLIKSKDLLTQKIRQNPAFRTNILSTLRSKNRQNQPHLIQLNNAFNQHRLNLFFEKNSKTGQFIFKGREQFCLELLLKPENNAVLLANDRLEMIKYLVKQNTELGLTWLTKSDSKTFQPLGWAFTPQECLSILELCAGQKGFLKGLQRSKTFKRYILPDLLNDPATAAKLLSSKFAGRAYNLMTEDEIKATLQAHTDTDVTRYLEANPREVDQGSDSSEEERDKQEHRYRMEIQAELIKARSDFVAKLNMPFFKHNHPVASILRSVDHPAYKERLYVAARQDITVATTAVKQHVIHVLALRKQEKYQAARRGLGNKRIADMDEKEKNNYLRRLETIREVEAKVENYDSFNSEEIANLFLHYGHSLLGKLTHRIVSVCTKFIVRPNDKPEKKNDEAQEKQSPADKVKSIPEIFYALDKKTQQKYGGGFANQQAAIDFALKSYEGQPLTYAKLKQIPDIWRVWHSKASTLFAPGRWFKPEGMPETMREIQRLINRIPKDANLDEQVDIKYLTALTLFIEDRQKRNSKSTRNLTSHTSLILNAVTKSSSFSQAKSKEEIVKVGAKSLDDMLEAHRLIRKQLNNRNDIGNKSAVESVLDTIKLVLDNFIIVEKEEQLAQQLMQANETETALLMAQQKSLAEERKNLPHNLKDFADKSRYGNCWYGRDKFLAIHIENFKTWSGFKAGFMEFIQEFINAYYSYNNANQLIDFFDYDTSNACIEGRTRPKFEKVAKLPAADEIVFSQSMKHYVRQAMEYYELMDFPISVTSVTDFIYKRHKDEKISLAKAHTTPLLEAFQLQDIPDCILIGHLDRQNIEWYVKKSGAIALENPALNKK